MPGLGHAVGSSTDPWLWQGATSHVARFSCAHCGALLWGREAADGAKPWMPSTGTTFGRTTVVTTPVCYLGFNYFANLFCGTDSGVRPLPSYTFTVRAICVALARRRFCSGCSGARLQTVCAL